MMSNKLYTFFLIIPLGLELLAKKEIIEKSKEIQDLETATFEIIKGGINITTNLKSGLLLNYYLKIPTRILLRINSFKCRDFPKLFKKISKINWSEYLNNPNIIVQATSAKSRLINTKRIEKATIDGIKSHFKANTPSKKMLEKVTNDLPQVFIRISDDQVQISIDTTGERLNIRSYRTHIGKAPIRENLAAALVYSMFSNCNSTLVDPMCGSGTFLLEAMSFYMPNSNRSFVFEAFNLAESFLPICIEQIKQSPPFLSYIGSDIENESINISKENLKNLGTSINADFIKSDLFEENKHNYPSPISIIINPPYGKRIKVADDLHNYFQKIIDCTRKRFNPIQIGIIIPANINYKKLKFENYSITNILKISNGGIKINFLRLTIDS